MIVSNVSLHNFDEIDKKNINIRDIVEIERAGDVIPHVTKLVSKKSNINNKIFPPKVCPDCKGKTIRDKGEAILRCSNKYGCDSQKIGQLVHFVGKKSLNIDGFGEKQIKQFYNLKLIENIEDIFNLKKYKIKILNLEGWGELSFNNLINAIEKSKSISLEKFLYALGIRYIGEINSELLAKESKNLKNLILLTKSRSKLENIDGLGPKAISSLMEYFLHKKNLVMIQKLEQILKINNSKIGNKKTFFSNKNLVFTGTLSSLSRDEAKYLAKSNGAKILTTLSKNTDFLITGEKAGSKKEKAKLLGIKIIDERDFLLKINQ